VIQQHRYSVALMNVLAHASTLRPKGRGINPVAIQRRFSPGGNFRNFLGQFTPFDYGSENIQSG
jgi:hypothetical protein